MSDHTPGPWGWFGDHHGIYLATKHSGRRYVMGFKRKGLNGAEPTFQVNQRMVPASDLVEFEVGEGVARGFAQGKKDGSVYRYDVRGIDCADARLIAAAPDLLAALKAVLAEYREGYGLNCLNQVTQAIRAAEG